jgi:hypothetical protein
MAQAPEVLNPMADVLVAVLITAALGALALLIWIGPRAFTRAFWRPAPTFGGDVRALVSLPFRYAVPLLLVAIVAWFAFRDADWLAKAYASGHFGVPDKEIEVEGKRPHDCDFLTAPLGSKQCSYEREYLAEWFALSTDNPPRPISYGTVQETPPTQCFSAETDFAHRCYYTELKPGEQPTPQWRARHVEIRWRKVEE